MSSIVFTQNKRSGSDSEAEEFQHLLSRDPKANSTCSWLFGKIRACFPKTRGYIAKVAGVVLLGAMPIYVRIIYLNTAQGLFTDAITTMDKRAAFYPNAESVFLFDSLALRVALAVLFVSFCQSLSACIGTLLGFDIRRSIVTNLNEQLFKARALYKITVTNTEIDNIDQRLTQDIADAVGGGPTPGVCGAILGTLACPSGLYSLMSSILFATFMLSAKYGWAPLAAASAWMLAAVVIILPVLGKISQLTFRQHKCEGDLRFAHSRITMHAESITFFNGEQVERDHSEHLFTQVYVNYQKLLRWQWLMSYTNLMFLGSCPMYIYFILYTLVQSKAASFGTTGDIVRESGILSNVLSLSISLLNVFSGLAPVAGSVHRVGELLEAVPPKTISLEDVTVRAPPTTE
eukprot:gene17149-20392_t